ncbi:hypothetical protein PENTCL1PPCAC_18704, partial [Pristionchus entomophagus]
MRSSNIRSTTATQSRSIAPFAAVSGGGSEVDERLGRTFTGAAAVSAWDWTSLSRGWKRRRIVFRGSYMTTA